MALETISTLFSALGTAANTAKAFKELLANKKGEIRLLLEELKKNSTLSWLVVNREVEPPKVIPQLSTKAYDRLLEEGYNFNDLVPPRKRIVRGDARFEDSDLASFIGKDVANLVEGIYDRIKEMQVIFQVDPGNERIDYNRRVINLHKRILLLMFHLRGWTT
jgi:hypothetical protein